MRLGKSNGSQLGGNGIMTPNDVMTVASGVPTPWNPGDNKEIRTERVVTKHTNFSADQADSLTVKAAERKHQAKNNRTAYKALRSIESSDLSDQVAFRGYQNTVARVAAGKKGADVAQAKTLHGLTPKYAGMGYTLGAAAHDAQLKVQEYQALYGDVGKKWGR